MNSQDKNQDLAWLLEQGMREVECLVPDINGVPRGKAMPTRAFAAGAELRLCRAVAIHTVTGDWADYRYSGEGDPDMRLVPVPETLKPVPWASVPRAMAIHDCYDLDGEATPIASRNVLKRVLARYAERGWTPVVAPELEFYVLAPNLDPSQPLVPPTVRGGRHEQGNHGFSLGGLNDLAAFFDEVYAALAALDIPADTFVHELGPSQYEINLLHGDALTLADQTFLFKYALREIGFKHGLQVVFMAKPLAGQPGSSMHIHQSVVDREGRNVFSAADGSATPAFLQFIAGQQAAIPELMPLFCPNVNSYRRFAKHMAAPVNLSWGHDNRSVGIRIPQSGPAARRVENRIPGCDANPYLALAASLAAGLHGIEQQLSPTEEASGTVFEQEGTGPDLPGTLESALVAMQRSEVARALLGEAFVEAFVAVKQIELDSFLHEISPWERRYLASLV
ncbi:glutamine synthetase family protein [Chitinimonas koreensis]|uniref:glutamine synthetase family protein n=1 Tax=Chitinimonas koreensis TaxID=356302 RepID=UPI0004046A3E|nr:glutamine synthetase family protein [Chitinimonas koreensis]QNM95890.1 glutamine synthetase [Chitinimonas koreensis]